MAWAERKHDAYAVLSKRPYVFRQSLQIGSLHDVFVRFHDERPSVIDGFVRAGFAGDVFKHEVSKNTLFAAASEGLFYPSMARNFASSITGTASATASSNLLPASVPAST